MSVEKPDFNSLIKEEIPFTIIPNFVLQTISNPLALSVYCYLISLPNDWTVNKAQLRKHFGVGRDKLDAAMKFLNQNYLIAYFQDRDKSGIYGNSYIVVKNGNEYRDKVINSTAPLKISSPVKCNQKHATAPLKTRDTDYPGNGKTAPTNNIINKKEKIKTNTSSVDDGDKGFLAFWNKYPKKVGKKQAQRSWNRLSKKNKELVMDDIPKRQDAVWKHNSKQYIPNPATYLNNERWLDDMIPHIEISSSRGYTARSGELKSTVPFYKSQGNKILNKRSKPPQSFKNILTKVKVNKNNENTDINH